MDNITKEKGSNNTISHIQSIWLQFLVLPQNFCLTRYKLLVSVH